MISLRGERRRRQRPGPGADRPRNRWYAACNRSLVRLLAAFSAFHSHGVVTSGAECIRQLMCPSPGTQVARSGVPSANPMGRISASTHHRSPTELPSPSCGSPLPPRTRQSPTITSHAQNLVPTHILAKLRALLDHVNCPPFVPGFLSWCCWQSGPKNLPHSPRRHVLRVAARWFSWDSCPPWRWHHSIRANPMTDVKRFQICSRACLREVEARSRCAAASYSCPFAVVPRLISPPRGPLATPRHGAHLFHRPWRAHVRSPEPVLSHPVAIGTY